MASALEVLAEAGVRLEPGLTDPEVDALETRFDLRLPPDYRALIQSGLPTGEHWPQWRDLDSPDLLRQVGFPRLGVLLDVEEREFWPSAWWGEPPASTAVAVALADSYVSRWPRLVPVHEHCYTVSDGPPGAPILSVVQTDVVPYGRNLVCFLERQMRYEARYRQGLVIPDPKDDSDDLSDIECHPWLDLEPWRTPF